MAEGTAIQWARSTWNPWLGCTNVSPGCDNCYAEALAKRLGMAEWGNHPRRRTSASYWRQPLLWNRKAAASGQPWRVFCASMADVFDNQAPAEWRTDLWALIADTPSLTWMLLTKRPQNVSKMLPGSCVEQMVGRDLPWPWPNVWIGTTAENQEEADRRIPHLLAVPARLRFLSCEPLIGPVDLGRYIGRIVRDWISCGEPELTVPYPRIDWIICGGESGHGARPMDPDWARSLRDQCAAANVPFFFKQWGGRTPKAGGCLLDGREHKEFPDG